MRLSIYIPGEVMIYIKGDKWDVASDVETHMCLSAYSGGGGRHPGAFKLHLCNVMLSTSQCPLSSANPGPSEV